MTTQVTNGGQPPPTGTTPPPAPPAAASWPRAAASPLAAAARRARAAAPEVGIAWRTALLLLHARGDEQIPYTISEELFEVAGEPKRILLLPGGHHRSIQHDLELQAESLKFVERAVEGGRV